MRPRHPGSPRALATFSAGPGPRSLSLFLGGEAPHPLVFLQLTRPILGASPSAAKLRCCHPTSPPGSPGHPTPSLAESRSHGRDSSAALFSVLQHLSEQQRRPGQVTLTLCPSAGSIQTLEVCDLMAYLPRPTLLFFSLLQLTKNRDSGLM